LVALHGAPDGKIVGGLVLDGEANLELAGATEIFDALGRVIEERGADVLGFITV
jgi:hypothetical protein